MQPRSAAERATHVATATDFDFDSDFDFDVASHLFRSCDIVGYLDPATGALLFTWFVPEG